MRTSRQASATSGRFFGSARNLAQFVAMRLFVVGQAREVLPDRYRLSYDAIINRHGMGVLGPWTFHSYDDGFRRLHAAGDLAAYAAVPFLGLREQYSEKVAWNGIVEQARAMEADVVFLHFFHHPGSKDPTGALRQLRALPSKPAICTSLGDPFGRWTSRIPASFFAAARESDVTFLTGMGLLADQIVRRGGRNLVLLPHGSCQLRFLNQPPVDRSPEFDVIFVGSRLQPRNPFGHYFQVARRRSQCVATMTRRFGKRFALVGKGWKGNPSWQGSCEYHDQQRQFHRARVVIGGMPNGYHEFYMSDRPFIAIGSGVPFVDFHVRGVEHVLEPHKAWWLSETLDSYPSAVERVLGKLDECTELATTSAESVRHRHSTAARCRTIVTIMNGILAARRRRMPAPAPALDYLPDSVRPAAPRMISNWRG